MPRPPRRSHPLREIRSALAKTQYAFAQLVGTSAITIKRIENGGLALSDKLAARISAATGASHYQLMESYDGTALGYDNEPYTLGTFERWTAGWNKPTPEKAKGYASDLSKWIELVCLASLASRKKNLRSVHTALAVAIDEVCKEYNLDRLVTELWESQSLTILPLPGGKGTATKINTAIRHLVEPAYHRLGKKAPGTDYYGSATTPT